MDILSLIENPFNYNKDNDILSLLFYRYYKYSDIPTSTPIFSFFAYISSQLVKRKIKVQLAGTNVEEELDIWVLIIAETGCAKTLSVQGTLSLFPDKGEVISPRIRNVVSEKSLALEIAHNPRGIWIHDEGLKLISSMESSHSAVQGIKQLLLELKTSQKYTRVNSNPEETIEITDSAYAVLFLGTYEEFKKMQKHGVASFYDGLFRRFRIVDGSDKQGRKMEDFPLYKFPTEEDEIIKKRISEILSQKFSSNYIIPNKIQEMYESSFSIIWRREKNVYLNSGVTEGIYRTYLMESFKYAVFDHVIRLKKGNEIDSSSMQTGLKIALYLLDCYRYIINNKKDVKNTDLTVNKDLKSNLVLENKQKLEKIQRFITSNPQIKNREIYRKFGITAATLKKLKSLDLD